MNIDIIMILSCFLGVLLFFCVVAALAIITARGGAYVENSADLGPRLFFKERNVWNIMADLIMTPFMYLLQGTFRESPQRTHRWNNAGFTYAELFFINKTLGVYSLGNPQACPRGLVKFHAPILGGWRVYLVIKASTDVLWHIGWISGDRAGISVIPLSPDSMVRVLIGPGPVTFFGIDMNGRQIRISQVGHGIIGNGGPYRKVPLL